MKVSVLVPAYNLAAFISPCLEGLIQQETDFPFEIIVVDDASSDNTGAIVAALAAQAPQLRYYRNAKNLGLAGTQKRLLSLAQGQYLAYMDGDDIALPGKLQALADHLDCHPDCALAYHDAEVFDSVSDTVTGQYSRDYYNAQYIPARADASHLVRFGCFINASAIMFRRHQNLQDAVDEGCKIILDHPWHILNALYGSGSVDLVPQVLGRYRIHSDSFGGQTKRSPQRREQVLADQLRACDNAAAFGLDPEHIAQGKAHYYFATALYFLKARDDARFAQYIDAASAHQWFFDQRHRQAFEYRQQPELVRQWLFGDVA